MSRENATREAQEKFANDGFHPGTGMATAARDAQHKPDNDAQVRLVMPSLRVSALLRISTTLVLALSIAACSILGGAEPIRILDPAAKVAPGPDWPQASWSLLVQRPIASQALDSERIVVRPAPGVVQVYKGAAWSDTAPDLVQTSLLRAFEDSARILSVARPGGAVRGEFQLTSELRAFDSVYTGASPDAVIELQVRLVRTTDGKAVAAKTFRVSEASGGTDVGTVGEAFSRALGKLDGEVVAWALAEGNRAGK
ncbi:MAG: ABC-type transport auxiliary lipoprotein family protein [Arenimonas sp.]